MASGGARQPAGWKVGRGLALLELRGILVPLAATPRGQSQPDSGWGLPKTPVGRIPRKLRAGSMT